MAKLQSTVFSINASIITKINVVSTKSLMPLNGDIYIWYGEYTGSPEELKTDGMLIPEGKLLEHVNAHDGTVSLISSTNNVIIHEVK